MVPRTAHPAPPQKNLDPLLVHAQGPRMQYQAGDETMSWRGDNIKWFHNGKPHVGDSRVCFSLQTSPHHR